MASGIEFFLTQRVQSAEKHNQGWEWWILDNERLNQDIIHMLINLSDKFCEILFGFAGECRRQPQKGLFDLVITSKSGQEVFVEIKLDQPWKPQQQHKQLQFLSQRPNAMCALLLLSQTASNIKEADVERIGHQFFKISYAKIYKALDALIQSTDSDELIEFMQGYRVALEAQSERTKLKRGDPNG
jgi:hypothetical protein